MCWKPVRAEPMGDQPFTLVYTLPLHPAVEPNQRRAPSASPCDSCARTRSEVFNNRAEPSVAAGSTTSQQKTTFTSNSPADNPILSSCDSLPIGFSLLFTMCNHNEVSMKQIHQAASLHTTKATEEAERRREEWRDY
ncbi:hypothetical protein EYF80_057103 [Liparis tanakae]|uniref:Uncharacterized protein n=1 Tax=Liparis tanakae TaxID=230148 RepID=A0A4Z2EWJ9_9TELE|nr:hypothetical protein EYF80_057103 [Liparis tanakae]